MLYNIQLTKAITLKVATKKILCFNNLALAIIYQRLIFDTQR